MIALPVKGAHLRSLLDNVEKAGSRTIEELQLSFGQTLSGAVLRRVISSARTAGLLTKMKSGNYVLTSLAKQMYAHEASIKVNPMDSFKPLSASKFINTKSSREGSDWSRDVYGSKQV